MGPASTPACPMSVSPPGLPHKDEYEKFKLYLTIILILISFTCRFLLGGCPAGGLAPWTFLEVPAPTLCTSAHRVTDAAPSTSCWSGITAP